MAELMYDVTTAVSSWTLVRWVSVHISTAADVLRLWDMLPVDVCDGVWETDGVHFLWTKKQKTTSAYVYR